MVRAIHVADGQHATGGDVLLELDPTENQAERDKARSSWRRRASTSPGCLARAEEVKAAQRTALETLHAPVAGTVQQLDVHTVGGVVTPAQKLLVIVPDDAGIEVEATLANRDVGFVHEGQDVQVKIETFEFTRYGLLHGTVTGVSRDTITEDDRQPPARPSDRSAQAQDPAGDSAHDPVYMAHIAV